MIGIRGAEVRYFRYILGFSLPYADTCQLRARCRVDISDTSQDPTMWPKRKAIWGPDMLTRFCSSGPAYPFTRGFSDAERQSQSGKVSASLLELEQRQGRSMLTRVVGLSSHSTTDPAYPTLLVHPVDPNLRLGPYGV